MDSRNLKPTQHKLNVESKSLTELLKSFYLSEYLDFRLIQDDGENLYIRCTNSPTIIKIYNIDDIITFNVVTKDVNGEIIEFSLVEYIVFNEKLITEKFDIYYIGNIDDLAEPDVANLELMDENISFISEK